MAVRRSNVSKLEVQAPAPAQVISDLILTQLQADVQIKMSNKDAQNVYKNALTASYGKREDILIALASAAVLGNYTDEQVSEGVELAKTAWIAKTNSKASTLGTWVSDMKRAMNTKVRASVEDCIALAQEMFEAELTLPDEQQILRQVYSRPYKMVVTIDVGQAGKAKGMFGLLLDGKDVTEQVLTTQAQDELDYRPHDAQRAKRAIKGMLDKLTAIHAEFQAPQLQAMIDFTKGLKPETLEQYRRNAQARTERANAEQVAQADAEKTNTPRANSATRRAAQTGVPVTPKTGALVVPSRRPAIAAVNNAAESVLG